MHKLEIPQVGTAIQDHLGHWYEVVAVESPYRFKVQALAQAGSQLRPIGSPFIAGRSDFRLGG